MFSYCSKGKKVCIGIPCAPSQTYSTCVDGWSTWKNIVFEYKGILNKNKLPFDDTVSIHFISIKYAISYALLFFFYLFLFIVTN